MDILIDAALVIGAYLLGSAPQLSALASLRHASLSGDYHMSLWYKAGKWIAVMGILLEFIKGAIPVLIGHFLDINLTVVAVAGLAVVCGQMWPVFHKFSGEKGNTTGVGMAAALDWRPFIAAAVCLLSGRVSAFLEGSSRDVNKVRISWWWAGLSAAVCRSACSPVFWCCLSPAG